MAAKLCQEGLRYLLEAAFSEAQTPPANFVVGLATDASVADNATIASLTQVSGTGYALQNVPSSAVGFPTSATAGTYDWHVVTAPVTFTGGAGGWTGAVSAFLATASDGKLIAWSTLGATRTLLEGDTLEVTFDLTLTG